MDCDILVGVSPPQNRVGKHDGEHELHMYEAAVMLAYAMHLMQAEGAHHVSIFPDGEHGKQFDIAGWLMRRGFAKTNQRGTTAYGGTYTDDRGRSVTVFPKPGQCDVTCSTPNGEIGAECKGGIVNTKHPGQRSRLYKGLCEAVGLLMATPSNGRQVAVVPRTPVTEQLAARMAPRCAAAHIEIALVDRDGSVEAVSA